MTNQNPTISGSSLTPGTALPASSRKLTTEEIISYSKRGRELGGLPTDIKNIHTDEEVARSHGLRGTVAPGIQTMHDIWKLMKNSFGEKWTNGGTMSVTFTNMVCGGDELTTHAVVREPKEGEANDRIHLDTWMENQLGEKVIVGKASIPAD